MDKIDSLTTILSNAITSYFGDCLIEVLGNKKIKIIFEPGTNSQCHKLTDYLSNVDYSINFGVDTIDIICELCNSIEVDLETYKLPQLGTVDIIEFDKSDYLNISEPWKESVLLSTTDISSLDSLIIEAISFVLGHEIGHFLKDDKVDPNDFFAKENAADTFAINNVKKRIQNTNVRKKYRIVLGTLLGMGYILEKTDYTKELSGDDVSLDKHPFTIVRLVNFLKSLDTSDLPDMWQIVYNWSVAWCKKSDISQEVIIDADIIDYKSECERIASELNKKMIKHISSNEAVRS